MGFISNSIDEAPVYSSDKYDERQLSVDNSTTTAEDESVFAQFISQSSEYLKKKKPIYDFRTRNTSFIQLYKDLKALGIQNNKFFLILYDKDLQLIDPYSPELPKEYQLKVYLECLINPWYFLREVLHIPADGKPIEIGGGVPYRIDRNNAACWYLFLNGIDHYQSKPRQRGKTQDCIAKFLYAYLFGTMSSTILFFNKDQDQANMNLYRMKCQRDMLPSYLQMRITVDDNGKADKGIENTKSIRNPVTNNTVQTMGKATSKESAMKMGRGATAALQYLDEFDFIPKQIDIMNAAAFAYSTAADNARAAGALYCRILSSTPGDLDTESGQAATEYIGKMLKWNDHMFDDPISKLKSVLNSPSYNRFVFVEHSWRQLKLTMKWYETACGLVSFNEETIMREIDLQRIHGSSLSPFKRSDIMYLVSHVHKPIQELDISRNFCPFLIYERLNPQIPYMCCIDPADGLGGDNNAVTFINPGTLKPAVEFRSPYVSQPELVQMLCTFFDRYCPKCMIIIENNRGVEAINCFLKTKYRYQLYYDDGKMGKVATETVDKYGRLKQAASERRAYGITTSTSNRHLYMQVLEMMVNDRKDALIGQYVVDDIAGLIRKPPNGRVEAGPGKHDDNIMSYLFGIYLYLNLPAEKLEEYGIRRGMDVGSDEYEEIDPNAPFDGKKQLKKLAELIPSLPKEMADLISGAMHQRTEADDVRDAAREIQMARAISQGVGLDHDSIVSGGMPSAADIHVPGEGLTDQAFWDQYDASITEMNGVGRGASINIEDLVD